MSEVVSVQWVQPGPAEAIESVGETARLAHILHFAYGSFELVFRLLRDSGAVSGAGENATPVLVARWSVLTLRAHF
jgi:hypothetical protein